MDLRKLKKPAIAGVSALFVPVVAAWVNSMMTGTPLNGVPGIIQFWKGIILGSVPVWLFALVFVFAIFTLYCAIKYSPSRKPKGKVHFIPDGCNTGWAKQHETEMNARIGGTFTYEGPDSLIVLMAFLKGTESTNFDLTLLEPDGRSQGDSQQLFLPHGKPVRAILYLRLSPVIGTPGQSLRREVIFRDNFNRDFGIGPVDFQYMGK
jgi:hypothetical protein